MINVDHGGFVPCIVKFDIFHAQRLKKTCNSAMLLFPILYCVKVVGPLAKGKSQHVLR